MERRATGEVIEADGAFGRFLLDLEGGDLDRHLMGELRALAAQVEQSGRKGTLTLALELSSVERGRVQIDAKVTAKEPSRVGEATLFYVAGTGELSRRDPRQLKLSDLKGFQDNEPAGEAGERGIR